MSRKIKFLIMSVFLWATFFCISTSAMENKIQDIKKEDSKKCDDTSKNCKEYKDKEEDNLKNKKRYVKNSRKFRIFLESDKKYKDEEEIENVSGNKLSYNENSNNTIIGEKTQASNLKMSGNSIIDINKVISGEYECSYDSNIETKIREAKIKIEKLKRLKELKDFGYGEASEDQYGTEKWIADMDFNKDFVYKEMKTGKFKHVKDCIRRLIEKKIKKTKRLKNNGILYKKSKSLKEKDGVKKYKKTINYCNSCSNIKNKDIYYTNKYDASDECDIYDKKILDSVEREYKDIESIREVRKILEKIKGEDKKKLEQDFLNILENNKEYSKLEYLNVLKDKIDIKKYNEQGSYFKKFIRFLYLASREEILDKSIDEIINSTKGLFQFNLFIRKFRRVLDEKFEIIEKLEDMKTNLQNIKKGNEVEKNVDNVLHIIKGKINYESYVNFKLHLFGMDSNENIFKYSLSENSKKVNNTYIDHVIMLIDNYKLTFFEKLEKLIKGELAKTAERHNIKFLLIGMKKNDLTDEYYEKILNEFGKSFDKDKLHKLEYLLKSSEHNEKKYDKSYVGNLIHLAENCDYNFFKQLKKEIEKGYEKKQFECKTKKILNNIKEKLRQIEKENVDCVIVNHMSELEEYERELVNVIKGKFEKKSYGNQLKNLFKVLSKEEFKGYIDEMIKLVEEKNGVDFSSKLKNSIVKKWQSNFMSEIKTILEGILECSKDKIPSNDGQQNLREESLKKLKTNISLLTEKLIKGGVQQKRIKEMIKLIDNSSYYGIELLTKRFLVLVNNEEADFLANVDNLIKSEPMRRKCSHTVRSFLRSMKEGPLTQDELKILERNEKISLLLRSHPELDIDKVDINICIETFLGDIQIAYKKNVNGDYMIQYKRIGKAVNPNEVETE